MSVQDIDADQDNLMKPTDDKGECSMETNRIQELNVEIEIYNQAIRDAEDALASAEMELDEVLQDEYDKQ